MNSNNNNNKTNFNKILKDCVKDVKLRNGKIKSGQRYGFDTEKDYQDSFGKLLDFRKKFKDIQLKDIDTIVYHDENNDGMMSAAIVYNFLVNDHDKDISDITFFPTKPNRNFIPNDNYFSDKNIIILDLAYSEKTINQFYSMANSVIVIDDHKENANEGSKYDSFFTGDGEHAAVGYTCKFFYPEKDVPLIIQYIDDSDGALFLPFTPFSHSFTLSIGIRLTHSKSGKILRNRRQNPDKILEQLSKIFTNNDPIFWTFIGKYMQELMNGIKDQIALNAKPANFQGYKVGVLNFNAPGLTKQVGRQINTNFKQRNEHIDFAVLWGYEYTANAYNVTLIDDHRQNNINIGQLCHKLGEIGGHLKGGFGHGHDGHFYWPKNNKHDIWELFKKKFI